MGAGEKKGGLPQARRGFYFTEVAPGGSSAWSSMLCAPQGASEAGCFWVLLSDSEIRV